MRLEAISKPRIQIIEKEMKREKKHDDTHIKHAPGWSEVMASVSEANVKVRRPRELTAPKIHPTPRCTGRSARRTH